MGIFTPSESINYNFIAGMYLFFLGLGLLFFILEFIAKVNAVQGFYLIFCPFLPASLWCVIVRRKWLLAASAEDKAKKTE
mmetsp:Transcript_21854/g.28319  ORF Transcript_21854/g.28319 Transcript_21854/m.28319 type:complete len:80 (-) Transcript_21854:1431-1670(-)